MLSQLSHIKLKLLAGAVVLVIVLISWTAVAQSNGPLDQASLRPVLLRFGLHVTPDPLQNPIDPPEEFTGYHVGADFEITADELETDVTVYAICKGPVAFSGFAEGYGGLVIQRCSIRKEEVTVLYGHLSRKNLPEKDIALRSGTSIGFLAPARSVDSGGNRKHLHLGIHRGSDIDYRGYVGTPQEIEAYIDPLQVLAPRIAGTGGLLKPYWRKSDEISAS